MTRRRSARRPGAVLAVLLVLLLGAACTHDAPDAGPPTPAPTARGPVDLTLGVYGPPAEVAAFQHMVDLYDEGATATHVTLRSWPDREAMLASVREGDRLPDVFMAGNDDIRALHDRDLNVPVFDLLDERGVSYGDRYSHTALAAFSYDDDLQCIPYATSPTVIYYNTDLLDLDRMRARGLPAPDPDALSWSFDEFAAAARFASRPRRGTKGVDIPATLPALAPFIYSGGGRLLDDVDHPTTLTLNDGDTQAALTTTLQLLRDPQVTLTNAQLAEATPVQWFERGKVAMIEGDRSLTPALRRVPGLHFDVMQMPSLGSRATVGAISGLCLARGGHVAAAADFLVHAISEAAVADVASSGYLVPADQVVARAAPNGPFLQPDLQPAHAAAFNAAADTIAPFPQDALDRALSDLVAPALQALLTDPVLADIDEVTAELDEASRSVIDPSYVSPSESPSAGSTTAPSDPASSD